MELKKDPSHLGQEGDIAYKRIMQQKKPWNSMYIDFTYLLL